MAEKILILYDNRVDDATMTASSEAGGLGADYLQDRLLSKVARTTGVSAEWWQADFGQAEAVSTMALWNHNLGTEATVRVRLSDNADMSAPVYDATFDAWPSNYGVDEIGLDLCGLDGTPILSEINAYKPYVVFRLGATYSGRYLRLDVADAANADGYLQAGRLIAGIGWQPERNFSFGMELDWKDRSKQTSMESGAVWVDRRERYRVLTLPFNFAVRADALGAHNDLKRIVGHSREILVMPLPGDDLADQYRLTVYGIPEPDGLGPVKQARLNKFTTTMKVRELTA